MVNLDLNKIKFECLTVKLFFTPIILAKIPPIKLQWYINVCITSGFIELIILKIFRILKNNLNLFEIFKFIKVFLSFKNF